MQGDSSSSSSADSSEGAARDSIVKLSNEEKQLDEEEGNQSETSAQVTDEHDGFQVGNDEEDSTDSPASLNHSASCSNDSNQPSHAST